MRKITVIGALPYEDVREDCHALKQGDPGAVLRSSQRIAEALPGKALLIPVPSHTGVATYTRTLAWAVLREARRLGKEVFLRDVCSCNPRESLCHLKQAGVSVLDLPVEFRLRRGAFDRRELERFAALGYARVLVDNVVDTGTTASAMMDAVGESITAAAGDTGRHP